jgi:predicted ATPase with chaperone activity
MLARRLTPILPAMPLAEVIETTRIRGVAGRTALVTTRPFRGRALGHHDVLFPKERPAFRRHL